MPCHAYNVSNILIADCFKHYWGIMQDSFTSRDVIALTGITARQLQWWDERGVVKPAREGHRRLYSMTHLTEVAVICELRRKGFSLQGVRKVMRFLDREVGKGWRKLSAAAPIITCSPTASIFIWRLQRGKSSTFSRIRASPF